ncbi:MAG: methylisocitrate lyase [Chloroflexi bacterium]|nr:methylisocitrate lyase [Chloroflexota bacterium]
MTWLLETRAEEPAGLRLSHLLETEGVLMVPGAFNPLVGLMARNIGFKALYLSGAAFSASLALPDVGVFTVDELAREVRWLARSTGLPVIADCDTGFGETLNVMRAVRELEGAGAAAVQLEDQVMPKRCGHLEGKEVVPAERMAEKVAAAVRARRHLLVIARTDARSINGMEDAVRRAKLYRQAGADIIFPEALETEEEFGAFAKAVGGPLLANMTEFGKTPYLPAKRFGELGYKIVIFPVTALRIAAAAVEEALGEIYRRGTQEHLLGKMQTREELYRLIGYRDYEAVDRGLSLERNSR